MIHRKTWMNVRWLMRRENQKMKRVSMKGLKGYSQVNLELKCNILFPVRTCICMNAGNKQKQNSFSFL